MCTAGAELLSACKLFSSLIVPGFTTGRSPGPRYTECGSTLRLRAMLVTLRAADHFTRDSSCNILETVT
jgi:hypothetical protein